ncbi:hypothetical protein ACMYR2_0865 [Nitrobacter sp. TKz-YC01]
MIKGDDNLNRDQHDDNKFKVQRSARIDNISESVGRFGHYSEFPIERVDTLFKFIFVFEPCKESLQICTIPQNIWLFRYSNAARYPVLYQQGVPEELQHPFSVTPSTPVICQLFRKWLDNFDHFRYFTLVMGKHNALRKDIGNDKKRVGRHIPQLKRTSCLNLILGLAGDRKDRSFLLRTHERATDPGL